MRDYSKLSRIEARYNGLINAKEVKVRGDRQCSKCGCTIHNGDKALTASQLVDKKYDKNYRYVIDSDMNISRFSFVTVRHWICVSCEAQLKIERPKNNKNEIDIHSEEFEKLSEEQQLDIVTELNRQGKIGNKEFQDIEDALINAMALRDAMSNEF